MLIIFFPFLLQRLVVKPDQLIKRRGKLGLVGVNLDLNGVKEWLKPRLMKETTVRHPPSASLLSLRQLPPPTLLLESVHFAEPSSSQYYPSVFLSPFFFLLLSPSLTLLPSFPCMCLVYVYSSPDARLPKQLPSLLLTSLLACWY